MKKTMLSVIGCVVLFAGVVSAQTKTENGYWTGENKFGGMVDFLPECTLKIDGSALTASGSELSILDGATVTAAELNAVADLSANTSALTFNTSVTNFTPSASVATYVITVQGLANNATNTLTLNTPYPAGSKWQFVVKGTASNGTAASNGLIVADSGVVMSMGAVTGFNPTDAFGIYAVTTGQAVRVSNSVN